MLSFGKLLKKTSSFVSRFQLYSTNCQQVFAEPFSKINVNLKGSNLKVTTADPIEHENKIFVTLKSNKLSDNYQLPVVTTSNKKVVDIEHDITGDDVSIQIPVAVDLDIKVKGSGTVDISSIENNEVKVKTEAGDIKLSAIKSTTIDCSSLSGNIISVKALHGNVILTTEQNGFIKIGRVQGSIVELTTDDGNIIGQDVYAEEMLINSEGGSIKLRSIHGKSEVNTEQGNIFVGTLNNEASLSSEEGDIDVYITKHTNVFLHTNEGDVKLYNSEENGAKVFLEASKYNFNPDMDVSNMKERSVGVGNSVIAELNGGGPPIIIKSGKGETSINHSSWINRIKQC